MMTNTLSAAVALPDRDLLARIDALARTEREATAELVAHLAALELRPSLYAAEGYGSLFSYCTRALRLSEDAACNRISAARACRRFPVILDLLGSGAVSLTTVRLLQPHLTAANHEAVLARAANRCREEIEALIAELAPQPDVPASVRKLPVPQPPSPPVPAPSLTFVGAATDAESPSVQSAVSAAPMNNDAPGHTREPSTPLTPPRATAAVSRPIVRALAPQRYRVQFTIGQETHDKLRRLQALMRREIPSGDVAVIFDRAVDLMLQKVERAKLGAQARPRKAPVTRRADRAYENRIRSRTDSRVAKEGGTMRPAPSRHIPNVVQRAVWRRDGGQCAFVSAAGNRCSERSFLDLHHIHPYALRGPASVGNISLRCRRHNAYEAELVFGGRSVSPTGGMTKPAST